MFDCCIALGKCRAYKRSAHKLHTDYMLQRLYFPRKNKKTRASARVFLWRRSLSGQRRFLLDKAGNHLQQFRFLERLADILVDAQLQRIVAMLVGGARGDHDDRDMAATL